MFKKFSLGLKERRRLASVSAKVDYSPCWGCLFARPNDNDPARVQELYANALEAWRKNPIAWRIISITTDYMVGDAISITSPYRPLNQFIAEIWHHPRNRMDLRLDGSETYHPLRAALVPGRGLGAAPARVRQYQRGRRADQLPGEGARRKPGDPVHLHRRQQEQAGLGFPLRDRDRAI